MATPNKFQLIIMITFLVFVFVKADNYDCIIPSGFFDGIVVDSSVAEPYYGVIGKRNHAPIQRTIFSCLPMYCDFEPCNCSYQYKKETSTDNFIYGATCFLKKINTYTEINYCLNGYIEDELHNCRAQFSCNINNGGCDQLCKHNDTSNADYCACNPGYFRYYDGKNSICQDCKKFGCQQNCAANPNGGVICSCNDGYILNSDKSTCRASTTPTTNLTALTLVTSTTLTTYSNSPTFSVTTATTITTITPTSKTVSVTTTTTITTISSATNIKFGTSVLAAIAFAILGFVSRYINQWYHNIVP